MATPGEKTSKVAQKNSDNSISPRISTLRKQLLVWFRKYQRPLPWRADRNPYKIWISEIMLQQTTVAAVIPYYERFLTAFPDPKSLAQADLEQIYELWAGLGYYSRARNLHKSAQVIAKSGFPNNYSELIKLPGLGPYTARAISSQAFAEPVGVLDGNVIRVLTRLFNLSIPYWRANERDKLQKIADEFAADDEPSDINQALMELGSTVCTATKPSCLICPISKDCLARQQDQIEQLPLKKPKRQPEIWLWRPLISIQKDKVLVQENHYLPFLKGTLIFPGTAKQLDKKPKNYQLQHSITHHNIYIQTDTRVNSDEGNSKWLSISDLLKKNPSSVVRKLLRPYL